MTSIAPHITAFLRQRLPIERAASPHTCDTYAYAFRLLFEFASRKHGVPPSALSLEHLDAALVLEFLAHLQTVRGNGPRTRNARLTAIKSFMHFVEHRVPGALEQITRILAIPVQKTDQRLVDHLTADQCQRLLAAPDPTTRAGIRDRTMLHLSVAAGLRVSELVGVRLDDVTFTARYVDLHVRGKGRKDRRLTLWKTVADSVRAWLAVRGQARVPELFLNARGTRDDARRLRVSPPQARRHRTRPVPGAPAQADLAPRAPTHLRAQHLAGDGGHSQSRPLARPRAHPDHGGLPACGRDAADRCPDVDDATPAASRQISSARRADRVAHWLTNTRSGGGLRRPEETAIPWDRFSGSLPLRIFHHSAYPRLC